MANQDLLNAFDDCITRLANGQNIDDCLRLYPQFAAALRPMLEAGLLARRIDMPIGEVNAARERVRTRLDDALQLPRYTYPIRPLLSAAAALLIAFFVITGSAVALSTNTIPGDALYGVKRLSENVQLALPGDDAALLEQFNSRRIDETRQLLTLRRAASVAFEGTLSSQRNENWEIAGLSIIVQPNVPGAADVRIGAKLFVEVITTTDGEAVATRIVILDDSASPAAPTSTPRSSDTPRPTSTSTATATLTLTPSPTSTPETASSATSAPSPTTDLSSDTCAPVQPEGWETYRVQSGDTLSALAASRGLTLEQVISANCITDARFIFVGQILVLPPMLPGFQSPDRPESIQSPLNSGGGTNSGDDDDGDDDD